MQIKIQGLKNKVSKTQGLKMCLTQKKKKKKKKRALPSSRLPSEIQVQDKRRRFWTFGFNQRSGF
jgi:hypothetical protein